jgi:hypothetical protein
MKNMENDTDRDKRTHDLYGEKDIPKSKILEIEFYMDRFKKEIVDLFEKKTVEDYAPDMSDIYDKVLSELVNEFPFGPQDGRFYYDKMHVILANALTASLWCGWFSQAMVNKNEPKFKKEYLEQFQRAITKAYELGRGYASQRP